MKRRLEYQTDDERPSEAAGYRIRKAGLDDAQTIATLVRELAVFVKHEAPREGDCR